MLCDPLLLERIRAVPSGAFDRWRLGEPHHRAAAVAVVVAEEARRRPAGPGPPRAVEPGGRARADATLAAPAQPRRAVALPAAPYRRGRDARARPRCANFEEVGLELDEGAVIKAWTTSSRARAT